VKGRLPARFELPRNVRHVRIGSSTADKSFFIAISEIPTLQFLGLEGMEIDNEVLQHISTNKQIVFLSLSRSDVTDEGVRQIAGMEMLEQLDVSNTACSDAVVDDLLLLPRLKAVDPSGSQITEKGAQRLKDAGIEIGMLVEELRDRNARNRQQNDAPALPITRDMDG
jgi:flagellar biosynthesis/type III secretory pathway chaperone